MIRTHVPLVLTAALVLAAGVATAGTQQPSLAQAKELYVSAAYNEALTMLDALGSAGTKQDSEAVALYRVLCLMALGRSSEADAAIETLVTAHPLYRPPADDLSPRIRTALLQARRRLLPQIIQQRYADAKAAFDREDFAPASAAFKWVLQAFGDPDIAAAAAHPPLDDLRTLAAGFYDLSEKALAPPPPPPPVPVVVAPPAPVRDYRRVYTPADADVVPPVTVRQTLPPFPRRMADAQVGLIEVTINAMGEVESARIAESVHPQYDALALSAAKKWEYEPARLDDVPVRYLKRVQVSVTPAR